MKRGLVVLDPAEVPPAEYRSRVREVQRALRDRGLKAALIYGDVYRSGDLSYLTNLCLYWNEAILVVPAEGEPVLLTKLSARVHPWMRATTILQDIRSGPDLAPLLAGYLEGEEPGRLGVVEKPWWPAPLLDQVAERLPAWTLTDAGPLVRDRRKVPSPSEVALLRAGSAIAARSVQAAVRCGLSEAQRRGSLERAARTAGAEDLYGWIDSAPGGTVTVHAVPEFRGYWTEVARILVLAPDPPPWARALADGYRAAVTRLAPGVGRAELRAAAAASLAKAEGPEFHWQLDVIHHTDLETGGEYRLEGERDEPISAGSVFSVRLALHVRGGRALLADTFHMGAKGATCLTEEAPKLVTREGGCP